MSACPAAPGQALAWEEVAQLALSAGLSGQQAVTATAITQPESGRRPGACGDRMLAGETTPDGRTWGPSIGLWQIRSVQEERGTGGLRDADRLADPAANAEAMAQIRASDGWQAWSTYSAGSYRAHRDRARDAVASATGDAPPDTESGEDSGGDVAGQLDALTSAAVWKRVLQAVAGVVIGVTGIALVVWDVLPQRELVGAAIDYATRGAA